MVNELQTSMFIWKIESLQGKQTVRQGSCDFDLILISPISLHG